MPHRRLHPAARARAQAEGAAEDPGIKDGRADLIAFGRPFLANPDLPERYRKGAKLNEPDVATFESMRTIWPCLVALLSNVFICRLD